MESEKLMKDGEEENMEMMKKVENDEKIDGEEQKMEKGENEETIDGEEQKKMEMVKEKADLPSNEMEKKNHLLEKALESLNATLKETEKKLQDEIACKNQKIKELEEKMGMAKEKADRDSNELETNKLLISELKSHCATKKKELRDDISNKEKRINNLEHVLEERMQTAKSCMKDLQGQLALERSLYKPLEDSLLENFYQKIPKRMQPYIAPKGWLTGEELGTFMGILVTGTAYNMNGERRAQDTALEMQKICLKSLFWLILGGLAPLLACLTPNYWSRFGVSTAVSFFIQCGMVFLWVKSFGLSMWQAIVIVALGVIGIGTAAGIPNVLKAGSIKLPTCPTCPTCPKL